MLNWIARLFGRVRPPATAPASPAPAPAPTRETARETARVDKPSAAGPALPETAAEPEGALCRNDVFDRRRRACGYLFSPASDRHDALRARSPRVRRLFDALMIESLRPLAAHWPAQRSAYIALDESSLDHPSLPLLVPLRPVILLSPTEPEASPDPLLAEQIRNAQRSGLRIALEAQPGGPWFESLAWLADSFVLRFGGREPGDIRRISQLLSDRYPLITRIALDLATLDEVDLAFRIGCEVASGSFTRARGDWRGNQIAPGHLRVAALLTRIGNDSENREIAAALKQDLALSYRLLRYVNASSTDRETRIASIEQALLLLGRQQLHRWLSLLFFSSLNSGAEQDALMEAALVRARMMETLGDRLDPEGRDDLFITGLFSLLDLMLQVPMETALEPLNLPPAVRSALLDGSGPCADYLNSAAACESGDLAGLMQACKAIGTRPIRASQHHFDALAWVHAVADAPAEVA